MSALVPIAIKPQVEYLLDTCWACQKPVKQVYGYFEPLEDAEAEGGWHERAFSVASISVDLAEIMTKVSNSELTAPGLNTLVERTSVRGNRTNWAHSNLCLHCRAPQDNFHLGKKSREALYGLTPAPDDEGYEMWDDERITNPAIGLAPIERVVRGNGSWVIHLPTASRSRDSTGPTSFFPPNFSYEPVTHQCEGPIHGRLE